MASSSPSVVFTFIDKYAVMDNSVRHEPFGIFNSPLDDTWPVEVSWLWPRKFDTYRQELFQ